MGANYRPLPNQNMNPVYYCIALDDPGSPSFCTFAKNYFGTVFDIGQVMDRMARIGRYPDAVQAYTNIPATAEMTISKIGDSFFLAKCL